MFGLGSQELLIILVIVLVLLPIAHGAGPWRPRRLVGARS